MGYGVYGKMWLKSTVLLFWSTVSILRFLSLCPTPRQCLCRTMVSHVSLICFFFSLMLKNREKKKSILLFILIFKQSEAKYIERCYMCDEFRCVTLEFLVLFWYNLHLGSDHSLLSVLLCASGKYTLVKNTLLHYESAVLSGRRRSSGWKNLMPWIPMWPQVSLWSCPCSRMESIQGANLNKIKEGKKVNYLKIRKVCCKRGV